MSEFFKTPGIYPILDYDYITQYSISIEFLLELWSDCKYISVMQLRAKNLNPQEYYKLYNRIIQYNPKKNIIINDFLGVAEDVNSFGIHLGKEDFLALNEKDKERLRSLNMVKGTSSHSLQDLQNLEVGLWDYTGFGPIFKTDSKKTDNPTLGVRILPEALEKSKIPLVLIGGIHSKNIREILNVGNFVIASISAVSDEYQLNQIINAIEYSNQ